MNKIVVQKSAMDKIIKECIKNGGNLNESTIFNITKNILCEAEGEEVNKTEVMSYDLTQKELKDETKTFQQLVASRIRIDGVTVTTEDGGNVILEGEILDYKIKFMYILNDSEGVYIKTKSEAGMNLTEKAYTTFGKLLGYYDNWKEQWLKTKLSLYV
jgi:hypothetical protein